MTRKRAKKMTEPINVEPDIGSWSRLTLCDLKPGVEVIVRKHSYSFEDDPVTCKHQFYEGKITSVRMHEIWGLLMRVDTGHELEDMNPLYTEFDVWKKPELETQT